MRIIDNNFIQSAKDICLDRPDQIIRELLPSVRYIRKEYEALNPTRNDRNYGSFRINPYTGKWIDFATNEYGGDLISLCSYVNGMSYSDAVRYIVDRYRDGGNFLYNLGISAPKVTKVPKVSNNNDNNLKFLLNIWNSCSNPKGTIVEEYLNSRGITCNIPHVIRYHPNLKHSESGKYFPAMVSMVQKYGNNTISAIHRTYLKQDGSGKAEVKNNKMTLGYIKGGAIRLSKAGNMVIITEGLENALSVYQATGIPTWSTISAANMINVVVPPVSETREIIIAADNDKAGIEAANKLAQKLKSQSYSVKIISPDNEGEDFNDVLRKDLSNNTLTFKKLLCKEVSNE